MTPPPSSLKRPTYLKGRGGATGKGGGASGVVTAITAFDGSGGGGGAVHPCATNGSASFSSSSTSPRRFAWTDLGAAADARLPVVAIGALSSGAKTMAAMVAAKQDSNTSQRRPVALSTLVLSIKRGNR